MTTEADTQGLAPTPTTEAFLPFEAAVVREAALATRMARANNCIIEVHIGGRMGKRPVDVRIEPVGSTGAGDEHESSTR